MKLMTKPLIFTVISTFFLGILLFSCKKEMDDNSLCGNVECLNGGVCTDGTCDCPEGFTGEDCGTEINLCESQPCITSRISLGDLGFGSEVIKSMASYQQYIILQTENNLFIRVNKNDLSVLLLADVSGVVNDYYMNSNGHLCIATEEEGIYILNLEGDQLVHLDTTNSCMPTNSISAIATDDQESIYFGCFSPPLDQDLESEYIEGYGLFKTDYQGNSCTEWTKEDSGLEGNLIQDIDLAENGQVWIAAQNKRYKWYLYVEDTNTINLLDTDQLISSVYSNFTMEDIQQLQVIDEETVCFNLFREVNELIDIHIQAYELKLDGQVTSFPPTYNVFGRFSSLNNIGERLEVGYYVIPQSEYNHGEYAFVSHLKGGDFIAYEDSMTDLLQEDGTAIKGLVVTTDDQVWIANRSFIYQLTLPE